MTAAPLAGLPCASAGEPHAVPGMREQVAAFDWSTTPLGPREDWPVELRLVVQQMLDSRFPKAVIWGAGLTTLYNDAFVPILGDKPAPLGRSFADIWSEAWEIIGPIADRAFAGEPTYIEDFPLEVERFGYREQAWFTFCYSPLRLADGSIGGMLDTVVETTGKMRAQAALALANQELGHRLKNTLALVQAIARQSLRGSAEPGALDAFSSRLAAMGKAHDVLIHQDWSEASLEQVVHSSIAMHVARERVSIAGPELQIGSRAVVALTLMLHELATNAIKYGALSNETGRVGFWWELDGESLTLHWQEQGGPPVCAPQRKGFGSRLIDMGFGFRSAVEQRYEADGFSLKITAPLSELVT
ncbi:sensor histidine kinase [Sphingomonas sp. IC081]|uniref:sensor histidine kinase n=1 Tax=Sphingomonas sp. IC081 TaxID=304378 RepID=UPI00163C0966|nr:sensor histidine kinase [Sphingomonas sp. IC081]